MARSWASRCPTRCRRSPRRRWGLLRQTRESTRVDRAWSRCMARRFYHYGTPQQVERRRWRSPPNKAEIATAVADVTCKTETNLLNTWLAVEAAYQQALIGQNLATLAQLQANFAPLVRRANANLAASA
jgi:hypothetical protein